MTTTGDVVDRLTRTIEWAKKLRASLQPILDAHGDRVHFRPASTGVAMVGLLPDRPQRGKSGLTNLERVVTSFEQMFDEHCRTVEHGKPTREKALQSFLIREAYKNGRRLAPINAASVSTNDPVELVFVTDEIALPLDDEGKTVCDVLALRRDNGRCTPVLLELKDARMLGRLVAQVESYAALIDGHTALFEELYGALLGEAVKFDDRPTEKWIVWPAAGETNDPQEEKLAAQRKNIRIVGYTEKDGSYALRVGRGLLG